MFVQNVPLVDHALAVVAPFHGHVALNGVRLLAKQLLCSPLTSVHVQVITDYVPVGARMPVRAGLLGLTVASVAGLVRLNAQGPGVSATLKSLWR